MKIKPHPQDGYYNSEEQLVWKIGSVADPSARIPLGFRAHLLRESLDYAIDLLATNEPYRAQRARQIVTKVLALQDVSPTSTTYGIWPKYLEEPLSEASFVDGFWADVVGFRLCKLSALYTEHFSSETIHDIRAAIGHAAYAVFARDHFDCDTKFALISAIVVLAGAEIVEEPLLLQLGLQRLREIIERAQRSGEFGDYNSPSLTLLAVEECDLLLKLVRDERALSLARLLNYVAWRTVTEHFHPRTKQWAGPHGWTDRDVLTPEQTDHILDPNSSCPDDLRTRLITLPAEEVTVHHNYIHRTKNSGNVQTTTWMSNDVCLGSADEDIFWKHRRPLIAYWTSKSGKVAVLRARFLHDGHDFASGDVANVQDGGRLLSSFGLERRGGDLHSFIDRPPRGIFRGSDFRVRYQLTADDAAVEDIGYGLYELSSGGLVAVIHTLPGFFDNSVVRWTFGRDGTTVYVDAVCYAGKETTIKPRSSTTILVPSALEILRKGEAISEPPELYNISNQEYKLQWHGLELHFMARPRR